MSLLSLWKKIITFSLLSLMCMPYLVFANEKISEDSLFIVTPAWKTFTENDGTGFYFELMRMIYEPLGIEIRFQITPWARSAAMVSKHQADALLGSYKEEAEQHYYPDNPIWHDISSVVFKRTKFEWNGIKSLQDKNVGWIRAYGYDKYINVTMNISKLINNEQAWKLLELDRIDYYIDSLTDLRLYMKENNVDSKEFRVENIIFKDMFVRFAKTEKGKKFTHIYDKRIVELQKNGELKTLYSKWNYDDYYKANKM